MRVCSLQDWGFRGLLGLINLEPILVKMPTWMIAAAFRGREGEGGLLTKCCHVIKMAWRLVCVDVSIDVTIEFTNTPIYPSHVATAYPISSVLILQAPH